MTLETSLRQVESTKLRYDVSHTMRVKLQKSGTRSGTFSERIQAMIEKNEIYPEKRKDDRWLRSITFKFPIPKRDGEVKEFSLESLTTIESIVCLVRE